MKIIYALNSDLGKHGTIGFRTFHVAKEAYKKGYLKEIICRGNFQRIIPKKYIKSVFPLYRLLNLGMSVISQYLIRTFPARRMQLHLFDMLVSRKLRKEGSKAEILHIYEYAPRTVKEAKRRGMKVVLDTQMAHVNAAVEILGKKKKGDEEEVCARLADKIIASSEFVVKTYIDAGVPKEKMELIPHGVDIKKFSAMKHSKTKKFTCLYVGTIERRKGVEYLLKAWERLDLPNAELVLCGRINLTMKEIIPKFKKNKSIVFTGFTDTRPYYRSADVFIMPSLFESSSKVLYEAMAVGLPIITTPNAGPPFKDRTAGLIVPIRSAKAIADKISYLKTHPAVGKKMGKIGRDMAKRLTWDIYGKNLMGVYRKMFSKK